MTRDCVLNHTWRRFGAFFFLASMTTGFALMQVATRGIADLAELRGLVVLCGLRPRGTLRWAVTAI